MIIAEISVLLSRGMVERERERWREKNQKNQLNSIQERKRYWEILYKKKIKRHAFQ